MIETVKKYKKSIKVIIIIAIIIAAVLALSLCLAPLAIDSPDNTPIEPQAVNVTITKYLDSNGNYELYHRASNWNNDNKVGVEWIYVNTPNEPQKINVQILEQKGETAFQYLDDFNLIEGEKKTFDLPNGGNFQIKARALNGSGYATLRITSLTAD